MLLQLNELVGWHSQPESFLHGHRSCSSLDQEAGHLSQGRLVIRVVGDLLMAENLNVKESSSRAMRFNCDFAFNGNPNTYPVRGPIPLACV